MCSVIKFGDKYNSMQIAVYVHGGSKTMQPHFERLFINFRTGEWIIDNCWEDLIVKTNSINISLDFKFNEGSLILTENEDDFK